MLLITVGAGYLSLGFCVGPWMSHMGFLISFRLMGSCFKSYFIDSAFDLSSWGFIRRGLISSFGVLGICFFLWTCLSSWFTFGLLLQSLVFMTVGGAFAGFYALLNRGVVWYEKYTKLQLANGLKLRVMRVLFIPRFFIVFAVFFMPFLPPMVFSFGVIFSLLDLFVAFEHYHVLVASCYPEDQDVDLSNGQWIRTFDYLCSSMGFYCSLLSLFFVGAVKNLGLKSIVKASFHAITALLFAPVNLVRCMAIFAQYFYGVLLAFFAKLYAIVYPEPFIVIGFWSRLFDRAWHIFFGVQSLVSNVWMWLFNKYLSLAYY